jgi:hypothetical protein
MVNFAAVPATGGPVVALCPNVAASASPAGPSVSTSCDLSAAALDAAGVAPGSSFSVQASYQPGDQTTAQSSATSSSLTSSPVGTKVGLASPPRSADFGAPVTWTAQLTDSPSADFSGGTLSFVATNSAGTPLTLCSTNTVPASGQVSCTSAALAAGTYTVTANWSGGNGTLPGSGPTMYTEDQAPVTGTLGANVPSPDPGKPVQLTAKVAGPSAAGPNAGTVIFSATSTGTSTGATTTICSATPVNGVATCAWVPGPGSYTVSAAFGGSANYGPSVTFSLPGTYVVTASSSGTSTWSAGAAVQELLRQAGFSGVNNDITLAPGATSGTYVAELTAPQSFPFFSLPQGAVLDSASVTVGPGTAVGLAAQASFPVAGQQAQATCSLNASISSDGSFSGTATVKDLSLAGSPDITLSGAVSGTPGANGDTISSQVQGTMAPISLPGLPGAQLSNVTVGLGTGANAGLSFSGTLNGIAQMSSMAVSANLVSTSNWTASATATLNNWEPFGGASFSGTVAGFLGDANGTYSYDLDLAPSNGSASFSPMSGDHQRHRLLRRDCPPARPFGRFHRHARPRPGNRDQPVDHRYRGRLVHRRRPGPPVRGHAQRRHLHRQRGP